MQNCGTRAMLYPVMLSIIIPVYNSEKYLASCIESVLAQTYTGFELLLVDDCSTDTSPAICESFAARDSRVRVIRHAENRGISGTRYDGFRASAGEFISFIDNDDLLPRRAYEIMMADIGDCDMSVVSSEGADGDAVKKRLAEIDAAAAGPVKSERMSGLSAYELLKSGRCAYGDIGGPWGKVYARQLVERTLELTLPYKDSLPWSYFEDCLFIPLCYPLAPNVVLHDFPGYLHRGGGLSFRTKPTPYLYGCIGAGNVVLEFYRERGFRRLYELYIGQHLVYLQSIWWRIDRFEDDAEKRQAYLPMIDEAFARYCPDCLASPESSLSEKLTAFLFAGARPLWKLLIGNLLLARKYRRAVRD